VSLSEPLNLGFLSVLHEPGGYLGGYLVINGWGRPLDFRLSTAVQPNRVQQILYGGSLQPYVCADLIGRTLVEKTATPVQLIVTDCDAALDLRLKLSVPVVWLTPAGDPQNAARAADPCCVRGADGPRGPLLCHPRFPEDVAAVRGILKRVEGVVDPAEPFVRIREAIGEARKMGVTSRN
jgi:hypothetical protein